MVLAESIGGKAPQGCMRTNGVVGVDVLSDPCDHLLWCLVLLDVEVVVFQTAEEPLGPYIIQCLSFAVHGDLNTAGVQELKVGGTGEVTPLIQVIPNSG